MSGDQPTTAGMLVLDDHLISALLNASPDAAFLIDTNGAFLAANEELARRLGRERASLMGTCSYDLIPDEVAARRKRWVQQLIATGKPVVEDDEREGRTIRNYLYPVLDSSGKVAAVAIYGRDMTETEGVKAALEHSRSSYEAVFNSSTDCIFIHDGQTGEIIDVNRSAEETFGYSLQEMQKLEVGDMTANVPPYTAKEAYEHFQKAVTEGPQKFEWLAKNRDGRLIWFENSLLFTKLAGRDCMLVIGRDITQRKQAEEALRESEERHRLLADNTVDCIWLLTLDGVFRYINKASEALLGYTPEEMIGQPLSAFCDEDNYAIMAGEIKAALEGIDTFRRTIFEAQMLRRDGTPVWVEITGKVLVDEKGHPVALQGVTRDISERREAEEALRESERRLQDSQRTGRIGHVEFNVITGGLLWSRTVFELYERDFDLGPPSYDEVMALHSPEDAARLEEAVKNAVATGEGYAVDLKVVLPSGRCGYHHAIGTPETDDTGRVVRITGTVQDVTERKLAEESYQNIATELEQILNSLPDAVIYADRQRIIRKVNPAFTRTFGYLPEEVVGKTTRIIYRNDEEYLEQGRLRYNPLACMKWEPYEIHHVRKDGTEFITETVGTMVRNARGEVVGLLGVVRDVSAQRQMQERMRLMEKMESVGRLAGGVAHDFNNMLNVILGHTEMALEKLEATDPLRSDLEEVRNAGERSAKLTRQLLAFARKQTIAPRVIDLNETISSALTMLERLIGESVELHWRPGKDLPPVNIDPGQVDQMLTNLAINARDAIGHRHGRVCIETSVESFEDGHLAAEPGCTQGKYVMLSVSDDGCGMSKETSSHIFEPFYTTKESEQGTGLGLATVYGIVSQNGGFITLSSQEGEGTTFRICLLAADSAQPASPGISREESPVRGSETILVVEDEPSILKMVTMMLEMEGYTVLPAGSPGEAIRLAREHSGDIELLVSDVVMPEMNGRDLARNIISLYPKVRRLFMSGYTADVIAHQGVLNEGVNFLQKPFSKKELTTAIRRALDD